MTIITQEDKRYMAEVSLAVAEFNISQGHRKKSLMSYRNAGEALSNIREALANATPKSPEVTEIGTFTSFSDYLKFRDINNKTAYTHIFIYENWELAEKIGLLEENACFRLVISEKIIRWAKNKLEDNPDWLGVAEDYFKEQSQKAAEKKEEKSNTMKALQEELSFYRSRCEGLEQRVEELERQLDEAVSKTSFLPKPKSVLPEDSLLRRLSKV